eukprot:CCRYP_018722-RA/>CCRYP_018722-RA protein AED:0.49 eAED:0.49 QI:0/0/0/1/0/0/2/0/93
MPLAPLGCNVQIHDKTDQRDTWAFHSVDGWYISTSPKHYRTHCCHVKSTDSEQLWTPGTNTIRVITKSDIPVKRCKDITYGQFVCMVQPEKQE